jgi:CRISPR-associated protein Csb2
MTFSIVAELPLGAYRGNGQDGRPERFPSVARLHSALLCAAGIGPRAIPTDGGDLGPCEADEEALRWLEDHPPDGVSLPPLNFSAGRAIAYRDDGTIKKSQTTRAIKKVPKHPDSGSAVAGPFVWTWHEDPPEPVRAAFEALCPDVPYLGTTESPARLTTHDADVGLTHERDPDADMFTAGSTPMDAPTRGRFDELTRAASVNRGRAPSVARDRVGTDERSSSEVPTRACVAPVRYRALDAPTHEVPWSIPVRHRVAWAVAVHRATIRLIGDGAPPLVTGTYPDGVRRPANRVALHLLGEGLPVSDRAATGPCTLAVLVPSGVDPSEVGVLLDALSNLASVRGPGGQRREVKTDEMQVLSGDAFWRLPEKGRIRLWTTVPAAVPETRGSRTGSWTFAHAALLSLAFAWRDQLPPVAGRADEYRRGMARAVSERGAAAVHVSALRSSDVGRYVHRINEHAVVRPYRAVLSLGDLAGPGTVAAIGQSRHLGGGLLVPLDVPEGIDAADVRITDAWSVR